VNFDRTRRELGEGVKEWRRRQHVTQEQLAEAADVHVNALRSVERGKGNPTLKVLWKIATKLKVTVAQLHLGPARE
jgi:transcriptional regulator with XRE-family HTH domain